MSWSDERVELLKKLWAEGLSASQIATRLGSVTRNAVIGKVHRLNLAGRATKSRVKTIRPRVKAQPGGGAIAKRATQRPRVAQNGNPAFRQLLEAEPFVPSAEELDIPLAERKSILTLVECSCRWPIGDPQRETDRQGLRYLRATGGGRSGIRQQGRVPFLMCAAAGALPPAAIGSKSPRDAW